MTPDAHTIWKKIANSAKAPQFQRIAALKMLDEDAPFTMLTRLINDPATPGRLLALAGEIFVRKTARKQLQKEEAADAATL